MWHEAYTCAASLVVVGGGGDQWWQFWFWFIHNSIDPQRVQQ
jgi:hypothetical protein